MKVIIMKKIKHSEYDSKRQSKGMYEGILGLKMQCRVRNKRIYVNVADSEP